MNNRVEQENTTGAWKAFVEECHTLPMDVDLQTVHDLLEKLNTKAVDTNYEFYIHQVVDGVTPPNVAPLYSPDGETLQQPYKYEVTGPVIQAVLEMLPSSVRRGTDPVYEVYQIRLDDYNSWEHAMGTTTLLTVFLNVRSEGGKCYFLPNDPHSVQNWGILKKMHEKHFPELPAKT